MDTATGAIGRNTHYDSPVDGYWIIRYMIDIDVDDIELWGFRDNSDTFL